ncbi:MAG: hypothetical protein KBT63_08460 [Porticoccaceae bacterium]|nr:hypothetical protein [Porticoccaceae bacterium]
MKFSKLPLSVAIAAAVSTGFAYADDDYDYEMDSSSVEIDKTIVYNQNIRNSGQITTMGLILVDSSAVAVSEVKQESGDNSVTNEFDTQNTATLSNTVLQDASGNIGVNVAAGDNNVQQNSVAIANASSANSSTTLSVDYTEGATNHYDSQNTDDYNSTDESQQANAWEVSGAASGSHTRTDSVTVDAWSVNTVQDVSAEGDATGSARGGGGAEAEGMAAWGEFGVHGGGGGSVDFLDNGETQDTDASFSAHTDGQANGSAQFDQTDTLDWNVAGSASHSDSEYHDENVDRTHSDNTVNDSDYRLTVAFDADFVFGGSADAETFSEQYAYYNMTTNNGVINSASVGDNVAQGAAGNIGINVAAGNSNVQTNQLALANNEGVLSTATASSYQSAYDNTTYNNSLTVYETKSVGVELSGSATGTYSGISDQFGDVYLDTWAEGADGGTAHNNTTGPTGHIDVDSQAEGAQDRNSDGGALSFNENGELALSNIALTGNVFYREARYMGHRNTATLGDNALAGASGNIGVNIAAGTNNLQGNALAISNASLAVGGGTGGTGGSEVTP